MAKSDNPYLHRFEILFSLFALIFSIVSLFISWRVERAASAPNVQLQRAEGFDSYSRSAAERSATKSTTGPADMVEYVLDAEIDLWNYGSAAAQIVDLSWTVTGNDWVGGPRNERPFELVKVVNADTWLGITSTKADKGETTIFENSKFEPLRNLGDAMIEANQGITLYVKYHTLLLPQHRILRLRLEFKLSDGRTVVATPMMRLTGYTTSW